MAILINGTPPERRRLDGAFRCFLFIGLVTLPIGILAILDGFGLLNSKKWDDLLEAISYVLPIPLFLMMAIVSVYGFVRTVQLRHPGLLVLSTVAIVCGGGYTILLFTVRGGGPGSLRDVTMVAFGIYIAANILIPGWWFLIGRREAVQSSRQSDLHPNDQNRGG